LSCQDGAVVTFIRSLDSKHFSTAYTHVYLFLLSLSRKGKLPCECPFFFFAVLGFELRTLHLEQLHQPFLC
jgi:hypothetical protein